MSEPNKDELADALSRLASGEAPSPPEGTPSEQVPLAPKPQRPAAPGSAAARASAPKPAPPPSASARPNAPGVQPPSPKPVSVTPPRPAGKPKPPKPVRPSAPTLSQPPVASPLAAPSDSSDIGSSLANVIDDDDRVIVPPPAPDVFAHRPRAAPAKREPFYQRLGFRRTMIPILLTMGVALPGCAVYWLMQDEDSPMRLLGWKFPITLTLVGLVLLALAILNMIHVKHQLQRT